MKARHHIADSVAPAPSYERFAPMGVRIFRCTFPKGAWQTYLYPRPIVYRDMPTCHIQTKGRIIEPTGVWPDHLAGWMSREDDFTIPAGVFTRLADEDSERWCCTGVSDEDDTAYVRTLAVAPGQQIDVRDNTILVVAGGALKIGARVLRAGARARLLTAGPATAIGQAHLFEIDVEELLRRYPKRDPEISR